MPWSTTCPRMSLWGEHRPCRPALTLLTPRLPARLPPHCSTPCLTLQHQLLQLPQPLQAVTRPLQRERWDDWWVKPLCYDEWDKIYIICQDIQKSFNFHFPFEPTSKRMKLVISTVKKRNKWKLLMSGKSWERGSQCKKTKILATARSQENSASFLFPNSGVSKLQNVKDFTTSFMIKLHVSYKMYRNWNISLFPYKKGCMCVSVYVSIVCCYQH